MRTSTWRTAFPSGVKCRPHSFAVPVSHHQRPALSSSPAAVARLHGAHPILVYPLLYKGCVGTSCSTVYARTSSTDQSASGLILSFPLSLETLLTESRVSDWVRRNPVSHASNPTSLRFNGRTLRRWQQVERKATDS